MTDLDLIQRSIASTEHILVEVLLLFLGDTRFFSGIYPVLSIPIITIPVAILISFIPFRLMGVTANIMSLRVIAIAVGPWWTPLSW